MPPRLRKGLCQRLFRRRSYGCPFSGWSGSEKTGRVLVTWCMLSELILKRLLSAGTEAWIGVKELAQGYAARHRDGSELWHTLQAGKLKLQRLSDFPKSHSKWQSLRLQSLSSSLLHYTPYRGTLGAMKIFITGPCALSGNTEVKKAVIPSRNLLSKINRQY